MRFSILIVDTKTPPHNPILFNIIPFLSYFSISAFCGTWQLPIKLKYISTCCFLSLPFLPLVTSYTTTFSIYSFISCFFELSSSFCTFFINLYHPKASVLCGQIALCEIGLASVYQTILTYRQQHSMLRVWYWCQELHSLSK